MSNRAAHRLALFGDRDVLHTGLVTAAACVFSGGLVYLGYLLHVLRVAHAAPCRPERGDCVLVFGKHAPQGRIDRDFAARLDRAVSLWRNHPPSTVVLLGGGATDEPSEAELARRGLLARGVAADASLRLEAHSRDTLQNLRNARDLLRATATLPRVTLLSSRYHLARCALFARQLGFDWELCAAEPRLRWNARTLLRIAGEAGYVCWSDLGTRWARLIGNSRMLSRVS
ncbi:MAG TPA: YdcF family protein [Luteimonas sp.]|nr:YdcF family protein [Luteimonas sp.]